jgi:hypothetical protein
MYSFVMFEETKHNTVMGQGSSTQSSTHKLVNITSERFRHPLQFGIAQHGASTVDPAHIAEA